MLPRLRAEEQLDAMNAAMYPHMGRRDARAYAQSIEAATGRVAVVIPMTRAALEAVGIRTSGQETA